MEVLNLNMMKHFLKSILLYERKKMNRVVFENIEDELKEAEKMKKLKEIMVAAVAAAMVISVPV